MNDLDKYRANLSKEDRDLLDTLLQRVAAYQQAIKTASPEMPQLMALLAMLLEEHKEIQILKQEIEELRKQPRP
jgi:phage shock protein A